MSENKKPTRQPQPWPKEHDEVEENTFEGHRNQAQTAGARARGREPKPAPPEQRKKVVALQLDPLEYQRFQELGGAGALRHVLADETLCKQLAVIFKASR
ncbi:hypothetical protein [Acanthopleuribacter pedis]|uniref:Uncharacterized protein n=1 Tax=Acanthopleuribacter pedis TaxID=442870 RepID=A0A8J7U6U6_9BACT|nr:hypothetical protein [Acanthopleuribacter pedis]MBO1322304.1 hypothetical protein [Acanthopleuribacter pedis]